MTWMTEVYELFSSKENPTFCKIPGGFSIGTQPAEEVELNESMESIEFENIAKSSKTQSQIMSINTI